jgi:hypothetical protein
MPALTLPVTNSYWQSLLQLIASNTREEMLHWG